MSIYNIKKGHKGDMFFVTEQNTGRGKGGERKPYFIRWITYSVAKAEAWIKEKEEAQCNT